MVTCYHCISAANCLTYKYILSGLEKEQSKKEVNSKYVCLPARWKRHWVPRTLEIAKELVAYKVWGKKGGKEAGKEGEERREERRGEESNHFFIQVAMKLLIKCTEGYWRIHVTSWSTDAMQVCLTERACPWVFRSVTLGKVQSTESLEQRCSQTDICRKSLNKFLKFLWLQKCRDP